MDGIPHSTLGLAACAAAWVAALALIEWAPAPVGFLMAAASALAWCRWSERHPAG